MASVQSQIPFQKKKSSLTRKGKENIMKSPVKTKVEEICTTPKNRKRLSSGVTDDSSPPKQASPSVLLDKLDLNVKENKGKDLSAAIRALHTSQPCELPGRENKIEEISDILRNCLETYESTTLYISGQPGTGKTACLNYILSRPELIGGYKTVYVNCTGIKSSNSVYKRISQELNIKVKSSEKLTQNTILNYLRKPHKMILLVLDEMDQLESRHQSILYSIFEWPSIPETKLVLIGIANALDLTDRVLPRLQARLELQPTLIHFNPYTKEEIIKIITNRLDTEGVGNILVGGSLQLLASKVAVVSGDIRKALDVARRVIELAQLNDKSGNTVSMNDVMSVVNNVYKTASSLDKETNDDAETFPLQQKLAICSAVLIKQNSKSKELSIGRLHDVYSKICKKRNIGVLDLSEFLSLAQLIESRGIIKIQGKNKNRLSKVTLQWDENEVANTLKDKQLLSEILADTSSL